MLHLLWCCTPITVPINIIATHLTEMEDVAYCSCLEMELVVVEWPYQDQNRCLCTGILYCPGQCWTLCVTNNRYTILSWSVLDRVLQKLVYHTVPVSAGPCVLQTTGILYCPGQCWTLCVTNNRYTILSWSVLDPVCYKQPVFYTALVSAGPCVLQTTSYR